MANFGIDSLHQGLQQLHEAHFRVASGVESLTGNPFRAWTALVGQEWQAEGSFDSQTGVCKIEVRLAFHSTNHDVCFEDAKMCCCTMERLTIK